jgi:hypothetical protein
MLVAGGLWMLMLGAVIRLLQGFVSSEAASLLGLGAALVAMLAVWTGVICHQLNYLLIGPRHHLGRAERTLLRLVDFKLLILSGAVLLAMGLSGLIYFGRPQPAAGATVVSVPLFVVVFGATTLLVGIIVRVIWAVGEKQKALVGDEYRSEPPALPEARSIPAYPVDPARLQQLSVS